MLKGRLYALIGSCILLASLQAYSQTPPSHGRLLYSHSLTSGDPNPIGQVTNSNGSFTTQGWQVTKMFSQLKIDFTEFLPHEGTIEFKLKGLSTSNIPNTSDFDWTAFSVWSRSTADFSIVDKTPGSYFMLKTDQGLYDGNNTAFKLFTAPYFGDKNRTSHYPVAKIWNTGQEYTIKIIWGREKNSSNENMYIWLLINDKTERVHSFNGQYESFGYLFLGKDDTYEAIPGAIFRDLKVYAPSTDFPFMNIAKSKKVVADQLIGGQSAAIARVNSDQSEDIYVSRFFNLGVNHPNQLFIRQSDETFTDEAGTRGVNDAGYTYNAVFADFDQDGDQDVFYQNLDGPGKLLFNDGKGNFTDVSAARGISSSNFDTKAVTILDVEGDNDIDILVINGTAEHKLYINNGTGFFTAEQRGLENFKGTSSSKYQSAVAGDLDGDNFPDIVLVRSDGSSLLFMNDRNNPGRFTEQSATRGFLLNGKANSATLADYDRDGDLDIFVAMTTSEGSTTRMELFRNSGGNFTRITETANIQSNSFGVTLADFDNDSDLDLYAPRRDAFLSRMYKNDGLGNFAWASTSGAEVIFADGRGAVPIDVDQNGFMDIYAVSRGGIETLKNNPYSRNYLLQNNIGATGNGNNYIKVEILNDKNAGYGLGSKIWVYKPGLLGQPSGLLGYREVMGSIGYLSQAAWEQHFGVGTQTSVDVKVVLPDGKEKIFNNQTVNRTLQFKPSAVTPQSLHMISGGSQTGTVGQNLSVPIVVEVRDVENKIVKNHAVTFQITTGNGSLDNSANTSVTKSTGEDGRAQIIWKMGTVANVENVLQISSSNDGKPLTNSPLFSRVTPTAGTPAKLRKVSGDGQSGYVGLELPNPIVTRVTDSFDNFLSDVPVTFRVTLGGGTLNGYSNPVVVNTDAEGLARVSWKLGPNQGSQQVEATASYNNSALQGSPMYFSATAQAPLRKLVYQSGNNQTGTVNTLLASSFCVTLTDNSNNPLANQQIRFIVSAGGGKFSGSDTSIVLTDSQGRACATAQLGSMAGDSNHVYLAYADGASGSPVTFKASARAGAVAQLLIHSGDSQTGTVGQTLPEPFIVRVLDAYGNPIRNENVTFTVTSGGGKINQATFSIVPTDAQGMAQARLTLSFQAGLNTVTATAANLPGTQRTFNAITNPANPYQISKESGDNQGGFFNTPLSGPFVVKVTDFYNNPIYDHPVIFKVTLGGGKLSGQDSLALRTDNQGLAQAVLTIGPTENLHQVTVTSRFNGSHLSASPLLFQASTGAGTPETLALVDGNDQIGRIGARLSEPFRVKVIDENGFGVASHPVDFITYSPGAHFSGQPIANVLTNQEGIASVYATLGTEYGEKNYVFEARSTFESKLLTGSPIQIFASGRKSLAKKLVNIMNTNLVGTVGSYLSDTLKVKVVDANDVPVSQHPVTFNVIEGNGLVEGSSTTWTVDSDLEGIASARVLLPTLPGSTKIHAISDDGIDKLINSPQQFTIQAKVGAPNAAKSSITANSPVLANGQNLATCTVTLKDAFDNPVANRIVVLQTLGVDAIVIQPSKATDANGQTVGYVSSINVGQVTIWVKIGETLLVNTAVQFLTGPPALVSPFGSDQVAEKGKFLRDPVGVIVNDEWGHPVQNVQVSFSVRDGGGSITPTQPIKTNAEGFAAVNWKLGSILGEQHLTSRVTGMPDEFLFTAIAIPPSFARFVKVSGDSLIGQINKELPESFIVAIFDTLGKPISDIPVRFDLIAGQGTFLTPNTVQTDAQGFAAARFKPGTMTGIHRITATALPYGLGITFQAIVQTEPTLVLKKITSDGQVLRPLSSLQLEIRAVDAFERPLPGELILFQLIEGTGSLLEPQPVTTDANGISRARWTLGSKGSQKVKVTPVSKQGAAVFFSAAVVNNAPVFTTVPNILSAEVGKKISFIVYAEDVDQDKVHYGVRNLPVAATFDSLNSRLFNWQPLESQVGKNIIQFIARDAYGAADTATVTINVTISNRCPVIINQSPQDTIVVRNYDRNTQLSTFVVTAMDPDPNTTLQYEWWINDSFAGDQSLLITQFLEPVYPNPNVVVRVTVSDGICTQTLRWHLTLISAVEMNVFQANVVDYRVRLDWETKSETHNAGFHVLRGERRDGPYLRITTQLLTPVSNGKYSFIDKSAESGKKYFYKIQDVDLFGATTEHGPVEVEVALPTQSALAQNYPNPFNPSTTIRFELPAREQVHMVIYNSSGQLVRTLVQREINAGVHEIIWDARNEAGEMVPSGMYYYQMKAGSFKDTKKLVLLK